LHNFGAIYGLIPNSKNSMHSKNVMNTALLLTLAEWSYSKRKTAKQMFTVSNNGFMRDNMNNIKN